MNHRNNNWWQGSVFAAAKVITSAALLFAVSTSLLFAQEFDAKFNSATGWVKPGEQFPILLDYKAGPSGATGATVALTLADSAIFISASQAPTAMAPVTFDLGNLSPGESGRIVVQARAMDRSEDARIVWKSLSSSAIFDDGSITINSETLGPKVIPPGGEYNTARYGYRPFPLVMVEYQDIQHCNPVDFDADCPDVHTRENLDEAVNSRTTGSSLWQLYNDMSFGQLQPDGQVRPLISDDEAWAATQSYPYKWSSRQTSGTCTSTYFVDPDGNPNDDPAYVANNSNRIDDGWYVLPRDQAYYGADATGHGLVGFVSGGLLLNIDDACGPTGKIAYDAAAIADPDLDYNEFDTDKDGVVDFLNVAFAGLGGNGNVGTGTNNVWPHKSDLQYYFTDENGETGYVSNDQLKSHTGEPMFWIDSDERTGPEVMTTTDTGHPVYVRVGPYNVNPESAIEAMSVIAHEYGHSLGLPDFYSLGNRDTFGSWELMATDLAQFMTVFNRQELGWIVPRGATDGPHTLRESKTNTGEIHWFEEDGTPYTLSGDGIHNADAIKVDLPRVLVIEEVPSGERAWHSGAGNDFGCAPEAGHNLDVFLPELKNAEPGSNVELSFESLYEMEWDWDFGFLLVSTDGLTWTALPSAENTTYNMSPNPGNWDCYNTYQHGVTGVSRTEETQRNLATNPDRYLDNYPEAQWIRDRFDLSAYAGDDLIIRFTYFTDPAKAKRGWFIDDINVTVDGDSIYSSDFEDAEGSRLFSTGWSWVSTSTGAATDHAYYIELRDRLDFDYDSNGQAERTGGITWQPGVAVLYTNENHGYGNTGVDNPPAQTILDSQPSPGNDSPNLNDAAFRNETGRDVFNACNHFDNYDNPAGGEVNDYWKLPEGIRMTVTGLSNITDPNGGDADNPGGTGMADLIVDVYPDCSIITEPPVIEFGAGHDEPDGDGSYELVWNRPAPPDSPAAVGPDTLQEATLLANILADDAEALADGSAGMGNWTLSREGSATYTPTAVDWHVQQGRGSNGLGAFFTEIPEQARSTSTIMTWNESIVMPGDGATTLYFTDHLVGELDDKGVVEVSTDGGANWVEVYSNSNPVYIEEAPPTFEEPLTLRQVDLSQFHGETIMLRFRFFVGPTNYTFYTPYGWWVDDIRMDTANWADITETSDTSYLRSGLTNGTYYYRVKTRYGDPGAPLLLIDSGWSNVISTTVEGANQPPDAVDDSANTDQGVAVDIPVLANDSDPENDPISISGFDDSMSNGTVTDNGNGTLNYSPDMGFSGTDTFTYTITDGNSTDSATVTVHVRQTGNTDPVAGDDAAETTEDTPVMIYVLDNDDDPDGDDLEITMVQMTTDQGGTAAINDNGTSDTTDDFIDYTPATGFSGEDTFTYTIGDGRGGNDGAIVTVQVQADENTDPVANDDFASTAQDHPVTISVLANDSDADKDPLSVDSATDGAHGTTEINPDGTVTYTPDPGYFGEDSFMYTISDGRGGSAGATVTVEVFAPDGNRAPDARKDKAKTPKNTPIVLFLTANDKDKDGDELTIIAVSTPDNGGSVTINSGGTSVLYDPATDFVGDEKFTYTISDGRGGTDSAEVKVKVTKKDKDDDGSSDDQSSHDDSSKDDHSSDDGSSREDGCSRDADCDGISDGSDPDIDNDGVANADDPDDDNDDHEDGIDSPGYDQKQSQSSAAPAFGSISYLHQIDARTASLFVIAEGAGTEMLQIQILDSAGMPVGTSIVSTGQLTSFVQTFLMGTYTITISNPTAFDIEFDYVTVRQQF